MKGIAHFISAVAAASFLPQAVHMSAQGSFILLLAGLGGIMPDALDFRLARYLPQPDVEIDADPHAPDPQAMAGCLASAVKRAYQIGGLHSGGASVYVRLYAMRLGVDRWRRYSVHFDEREVCVRLGPLVTASQEPCPDSAPDLPVGCAPLAVPVRHAGDVEIQVDVFAGPAFEFRRRGEAVEMLFLPWHRRWSHSLTFAALLAGAIALLLGPLYGLIYALGSLTHILEDQLGHMGSNLAFPFTRARTRGLGLFHSGDTLPNLFAVWLSVVLILFNLDRFSAAPTLDPWPYFLAGLAFPWALVVALSWWNRHRRAGCRTAVGDVQSAEVLAEADAAHTETWGADVAPHPCGPHPCGPHPMEEMEG